MLSKIIQIALKDIRIQFSQRSQWLFFLILPLLFILIFGGAFSGDTPSGIGMLVVDQDQSTFSADLLATLAQSDGLAPEISELGAAEVTLDERDTTAVLVIPNGFAASIEAGESAELDLRIQPNDSNGLIVGQAIQAAVEQLSRPILIANQMTANYEAAVGFADAAARDVFFTTARETAAAEIAALPQQIERTQSDNSAESGFDIATQQVTGQLITWVFIPLLGTSVLFTTERTRGTLRRLVTTPTAKVTYLLGVILGQALVGGLQVALLVSFGVFMYDLNFANDLFGLGILMTSFILAGVALGTTIGTLVKSDGQANNLSIMFGMLMALLGGCWFPYEFFSPTVKQVANLVPTSWALRGMLDLSVGGASAVDILPNVGVLLGFAAIFFAIGVWRFRFE